MSVNKSAGPDGVRPQLLKILTPVITEPLALLVDLSLKSGVIPNDWSRAAVTLIHEKGSKQDVSNYKPVSFT